MGRGIFMPQKPFATFGSLMADALEKRGLSYAQVARVLGHKSKTTLHRILNDDCTPATAERFYRAFLESGLCELEAGERQALEEALEIFLLGRKQFEENQAMWRIFSRPDEAEEDVALCVAGKAPGAQTTLKALLEECFRADEAHLLVLNACQTPLFPLLGKLLRENRSAKLHIDHLLFVDGDAARTAQSMRALMQLMCDARLNSCSSCGCQPPLGRAGPMRDDWLIARLTRGAAVWEWQVALSPGGGYALPAGREAGLFDFWRDILREQAPHVQPIRRARVISPTEADFFSLMEHFVEMERNQALYVAKGGVFINLVPPDILCAAYMGGAHEGEATISPAALEAAAAKLWEMQASRYENRRKKYRSTYYISTRAELRDFARTGAHPMEFPFLRPYTLKERRNILQSILDEMLDNPYFDFCLLRDDAAQSRMQMCFLEDGGVFFIAPCSSAGKYVEAVILQREFNHQLRHFFRRELLGRQAIPPEETRGFLARLIREMDNAVALESVRRPEEPS